MLDGSRMPENIRNNKKYLGNSKARGAIQLVSYHNTTLSDTLVSRFSAQSQPMARILKVAGLAVLSGQLPNHGRYAKLPL